MLLGAGLAPAMAQTTQRIAAVVNDTVVSSRDLAERVQLAAVFSGLPDDAATQRRLAPQVLRRMIDESLQLQEAARQGIQISDGEVGAAIERIAQPNGMTGGQLKAFLLERGIAPEALEAQVRAELAWARVIQRELAPRVVVTADQVDLAIGASDADGGEELLLSEILLPVYRPEDERQVMAEANELVDALAEGAEFGPLAQQVSIAASSERGGDLGWVRLSSIASGLRPAIAGLEPGEVSEPIRSPAGIHIFKLREKRASQGLSADPDARDLAQLFIPLPANPLPERVEQALVRARALRPQLTSCAAIESVAQQTGAPSSGSLGWIRLGDLPATLADALRDLPKGQVTPPLRSAVGVHLLMVCALPGEDAEAARRATIRQRLEQEQVQRLASRFLRDLRKDAFIDLRVRF